MSFAFKRNILMIPSTLFMLNGVIAVNNDMNGNFCVKQVDENIFPKCTILFKRGVELTNATCLEDNVFVVNVKETKSMYSIHNIPTLVN